MSIDEKVEVIGDSLHDIRGAITGLGATELGNITTYADAITTYGGGSKRNIGEIVTSTIPLTDAGLHLLDGALIDGSGSYSAFVDYIADLYNNTPVEDVYNVNIVGSLTNDNGVLSGFAGGVYATIKEVPYSTADSIEILLKTTTGTLDTSNYKCFYSPVISDKRGVNIQINPSNQIMLYVSSNAGSSWDIVKAVAGTTTLQSDTQYYFKYVYTGTNHILYMSTTGAFAGEETTEVNVANSGKPSNSTVSLGLQAWSPDQNNYYWRGSIDLNESYININGERWWSGKTERRAGFLTEDEWQQSVTDYGVCGKYVYTPEVPTYYGWYVATTQSSGIFFYTTSLNPSVGDNVYNSNGGIIGTLASGDSGWNISRGAIRYNTNLASRSSNLDITGPPATVRLPKSSAVNRYLIDSYSNGPNWYRVYSDGWCEQGGACTLGTFSYSFFKPFLNRPNVQTTKMSTYAQAASGRDIGFNAIPTINGFTINDHFTSQYFLGADWEARGYVDISNYVSSVKYEYVVIATTTKTAIQVDIDEIATDLNGKADVDLSNAVNNLSASANGYFASISFPSNVYENIAASTGSRTLFTYTAPADGWVTVSGVKVNTASRYIQLLNSSCHIKEQTLATSTTAPYGFTVPVSKGQTVNCATSSSTSFTEFEYCIFIYAKGEV